MHLKVISKCVNSTLECVKKECTNKEQMLTDQDNKQVSTPQDTISILKQTETCNHPLQHMFNT